MEEIVSKICYDAARNQDDKTKNAVCHVIKNRSIISTKSIKFEATKNGQFIMWEKDIMAKAAWIKCQTAAKKMLQEDSKDNTEGATHYRGKYEVKPSWLGTSKPHVQIGGLLFYKNIAPY